ncbi:MAG: helix-turn-helix domain-containing protein [Haloarculaceae archaeon]
MKQVAGPDPGATDHSDPIEVWLSVEPAETCGCACLEMEARSVRQSVSVGPDGTEACKLLIDTGQDSSPTYVRSEPDGECPRAVLEGCDCIPELERIDHGRLFYSVTMPHRSCLSTLVDRLRDVGATVSVTRVRSHEDTDLSTPLLTDKQREAFDRAISLGYYDRPKDASLGDIASELGISRSAASQRLCAVRRRLAEHYADEVGTSAD